MRRQTVDPEVRAKVIDRFGNECWLNMPECTGRGEEDDHIVPFSHGGRDSVANLRRACKHCNSSRQDRVLSGYGATLHAVIGPPCADLMGEAEDAVQRGAIVVNHADIMAALCPTGLYPSPGEAVRSAAAMAWAAAYRRLATAREPVDVWFIRSLPSSPKHPRLLDEWIALDYDVHVVDPGAGYVFEHVRTEAERQVARAWYSLHLTQQVVDARLHARRARLVELGLRRDDDTVQRVEW